MSLARACIRCGRRMREGVFCARCDANSMVRFCRHLAAVPAWRTLINDDDGNPRLYSVTVGEVTVFPADGAAAMLPLVNAETGRTLAARELSAVPLESELLLRATLLGSCRSCGLAFMLPDAEAGVRRGEPRILRQRIAVWVQTLSEPTSWTVEEAQP